MYLVYREFLKKERKKSTFFYLEQDRAHRTANIKRDELEKN